MQDSSPGGPPLEDPRKRRLRFFACGALAFLVLVGAMIVVLPPDPTKQRVIPLLLADVAFASVVCMVLIFTLRKRD